jgi:putative flippase GtrA/SAM-dependent methyltransferase
VIPGTDAEPVRGTSVQVVDNCAPPLQQGHRSARHQLLRYAFIGIVSFGLDFAALYVGYRNARLPLWLATSLGFWLSFVVNFAANKYWTFRAVDRTGAQLVRYAGLVAGNYLATVLLVSGLAALGLSYMLGKACAVGALSLTTFLLYRSWVFRSPTVPTVNRPTCCVCETVTQPRLTTWSFQCPACGTWASTLQVSINSESQRRLDEDFREVGLETLRRHNHAVVAERLLQDGLTPGGRLLDVGSAHGWFLAAARDRGLEAEGIEPDEAVAARAEAPGARVGYFPDVLGPEERFDAITFNDVLEHFPDVGAAVSASVAHLQPGGLLSVNIPNSQGLFYRLAVLCHSLGLRSAFERLWQVGLPSPHLWFFDRAGLTRLGQNHGLELVSARSLDSVRRRGLWQRAHADRKPSPTSVLGVAFVWLTAPLFNASGSSDIMHLVFRKPPIGGPAD